MQFTPENLNSPSVEFDDPQWSFIADLREYFPDLKCNYEIEELLKQRGVVTEVDETDTESSCFYAYFKTPEEAFNFVSRLNTVPEIRDYVPTPQPDPSEPHVMMSKANWDRIRALVRENVSEEKRNAMGEIMVWDVEV